MKLTMETSSSALVLAAERASEVMHANPISIRANATVNDGIRVLCDHGISAAPVIDEAGRPIGVISQSDILAFLRESTHELFGPATKTEGTMNPGQSTRIRDVMTEGIFTIPAHALIRRVVEQMVGLKVHRLFVIDEDGVLIGVISTLDLLGRLK
jgi:CBS domain-containing protein